MADHGVKGVNGIGTKTSTQFIPIIIRGFHFGHNYMAVGGRDDTQGEPTTPSLRLDSKGKWRFRWIVTSGARTISVKVKQAANLSPRPTLTVKANPSIGVAADVVGTAGASADWIQIGPVAIAPTSNGAVWVELANNLDYEMGSAPCYFDNIMRT